jgi:hypothetical protein
MTDKSFIFSVVVACLLGASDVRGQGAAESGGQVVLQSARNLYDRHALEAEFRYRIEAYDRTLVGSGRYVQSGLGPEKLFRLEMNTQLEDRKATFLTVCGKRYLWIRRDLGPDRQSLARIDLRRLRQATQAAGPPLADDPSPTWLGIVSLPKMLGTIGGWFVFKPAQEAMLGDRKVLQLRGVVNAEMRDNLLGAADKKGRGREQIPDAVQLTLGTDQALPLFPYRIEYLKAPKGKGGDPTALQPMLTLDFYSAKVPSDIDPAQFEYFPGDQEVEDRTRLFLERLGFQIPDEK